MEERTEIAVFCERCNHSFHFVSGGKIPSICPTCVAGLPGYRERRATMTLVRAA